MKTAVVGFASLVATLLVGVNVGYSQVPSHSFPLESATGIKLVSVEAEPVTFKGRNGLKITGTAIGKSDDEVQGRLAILTATDFQDGIIEVDLAGDVAPDAYEGARGFVGVAFRCAEDASRYECIYLRPTNGRAEDQLRRNHSIQYVSVPGFPWHQLRRDFPGVYESYVDLVPGEWTQVKIEVRGDKARLFVHGAEQPTLLINDLKQGTRRGLIALMIDNGTIAHFANLRVTAF